MKRVYIFGTLSVLVVVMILLAMTSGWPAHLWWLRLAMACTTALMSIIYLSFVAHNVHVYEDEKKLQLKPNESHVLTFGLHKAAYLFCLPTAVSGGCLLLISLSLLVFYPSFSFDLPSWPMLINGEERIMGGQEVSVPTWPIPLFVSAPFLFVTLVIFEYCGNNKRVITSQKLILRRLRARFALWPGADDDPTPLQQINDVNFSQGVLGGRFNWGTLKLRLWPNPSADTSRYLVLRLVPNPRAVADTLKSQVPEFNQDPNASRSDKETGKNTDASPEPPARQDDDVTQEIRLP